MEVRNTEKQTATQKPFFEGGLFTRPKSSGEKIGDGYVFQKAPRPTIDCVGPVRRQALDRAASQVDKVSEKSTLDVPTQPHEEPSPTSSTNSNEGRVVDSAAGDGTSKVPGSIVEGPLDTTCNQDGQQYCEENNQQIRSPVDDVDVTPPRSCDIAQPSVEQEQEHDADCNMNESEETVVRSPMISRHDSGDDAHSHAVLAVKPMRVAKKKASRTVGQHALSTIGKLFNGVDARMNELSEALSNVTGELSEQIQENQRLIKEKQQLQDKLQAAAIDRNHVAKIQGRLGQIQKGLKGWRGDLEYLKHKRGSINGIVNELKGDLRESKLEKAQLQERVQETQSKLKNIIAGRDDLQQAVNHNAELNQELKIQWMKREEAERQLQEKRADLIEERNSKLCVEARLEKATNNFGSIDNTLREFEKSFMGRMRSDDLRTSTWQDQQQAINEKLLGTVEETNRKFEHWHIPPSLEAIDDMLRCRMEIFAEQMQDRQQKRSTTFPSLARQPSETSTIEVLDSQVAEPTVGQSSAAPTAQLPRLAQDMQAPLADGGHATTSDARSSLHDGPMAQDRCNFRPDGSERNPRTPTEQPQINNQANTSSKLAKRFTAHTSEINSHNGSTAESPRHAATPSRASSRKGKSTPGRRHAMPGNRSPYRTRQQL